MIYIKRERERLQITKFRLLKNNFNFTSLKPPFKWIWPLWRAASAFWPLKKLFQIDFYPRGCVPSIFLFFSENKVRKSLKPPFKWIWPLWRAARAFWPLKKLFQIDFYPRGCVPSIFLFFSFEFFIFLRKYGK